MKKNGFTLVELLAVIVILAVIMIIAIPAVLSTMKTAKSKGFMEYLQKVSNTAQKKYVEDTTFNGYPNGDAYFYNIRTDLGLTSSGNFGGYVFVFPNADPKNANEDQISFMVWDEEYFYQGFLKNLSEDKLYSRKLLDGMISGSEFNGAKVDSVYDLDYEMIRGLMVADVAPNSPILPSYTCIRGSDGGVISHSMVVTHAG